MLENNQNDKREKLLLKVIPGDFSVCKVEDYTLVDWSGAYVFIGQTDEERSLVCETSKVPVNTTHREDHWHAFRIQGILDFSMIGILSKITTVLAEAKIGVFAVSTFNTDYILTKKDDFEPALSALTLSGYSIMRESHVI